MGRLPNSKGGVRCFRLEWRFSMPDPATEKPTESFTARVSKSTLDALETLAGLKRVSVSELVRDFITDGLERASTPEEIDKLLEQQRAVLTALRKP